LICCLEQIGLAYRLQGARLHGYGFGDGVIFIPELPRVHTARTDSRAAQRTSRITTEDIMDTLFLRLDAVIALIVNNEGGPVQ
jgi:hypothetical protein